MSLNFTTTDKASNNHGIKALVYGGAGCHAAGHPILMFDGSIKSVEDIDIGEKVMGPDSLPRLALGLWRGQQEMRRITPIKGESFVVNKDHILPVATSKGGEKKTLVFAHQIEAKKAKGGQAYKLLRTGVEFQDRKLAIPPYILGIWLGDGTSSDTAITSMDEEIVREWCAYGESLGLRLWISHKPNTGKAAVYALRNENGGHRGGSYPNPLRSLLREIKVFEDKHIPQDYLTSSSSQRLELLAGLIDTDGYAGGGETHGGYYEITQVNKRLSKDILFLARSLGFAAYASLHQTGATRISISGHLDTVPVRMERKAQPKRMQVKDVLHTGISAEDLPEDEYYGVWLDQDQLYLDGYFNIHHNSGKTSLCGTAPSPIIISAEAGLLSLRGQAHPVLTITTAAELDEAFEWCRTDAIKNGIKTVCLDSISEIIEQILKDEKSKTKDPRAAYGEMANRGISIVKKFRDLPGLHVLMTAKQATVTDAITGVAKVAPTAPGQQVGQALPYLFDLVMHAATEKDPEGKTYHYLRSHAAFNAEAKDRSGVLDEIEFPDFTNLVNKILAKPQPAQTAQ